MEITRPTSVESSTVSIPHFLSSENHLFQVFLRLKPSPRFSQSPRFLSTIPGTSQVYVTPPADRSRFRAIEKYSFTDIYDEQSTQRDLFEGTVVPLLQDAIQGRDGLLATLGVTGSGKTHTILGNRDQRGMTQLALDCLFRSIGDQMVDYETIDMASTDHAEAVIMDARTFCDNMSIAMETQIKRASLSSMSNQPDIDDIMVEVDKRSRYAVLISIYEVYNDRMFDLLDEASCAQSSTRRKALVFKKCNAWDKADKDKKVVAGLRKVYVKNLEEALTILEHGQACRHASPTNSNHRSSRSHAFFCIEIKRISQNYGICVRTSTLHIVDLAGSERARNAKTTGDRLVEAGSINRSLMCLGQCLQLQTQVENGKQVAVPYRQSKLTELLFTNSFTGSASQKASIIVTADPQGDYNSTNQILRYSALARDVTIPRSVSRTASCSSEMSLESLENGENLANPAVVTRLLTQLEETEARWRDAEERCLLIEQQVREEVAQEMEERFRQMNGIYMDRLLEEEEYKNEHLDRKLELIAQNLEIHEDENLNTAQRNEELEDENARLLDEVTKLKRELQERERFQCTCTTKNTKTISKPKSTSMLDKTAKTSRIKKENEQPVRLINTLPIRNRRW